MSLKTLFPFSPMSGFCGPPTQRGNQFQNVLSAVYCCENPEPENTKLLISFLSRQNQFLQNHRLDFFHYNFNRQLSIWKTLLDDYLRFCLLRWKMPKSANRNDLFSVFISLIYRTTV